MQKVVLKLSIHDGKDKQRALKAVSSLTGIDSLSVDMKESKLTVVGDVDPVEVVGKLRKQWQATIVTVGPAKEEKKDDKKEGSDDKKTPEPIVYHYNCPPYLYPTHYHVQSYEEYQNGCTIC